MGAVAAILHWDGRPVETAVLDRVVFRSPRVIDARGAWVRGSTGLAALHFATSPTVDARQPLRDEARDLAFVFDGRLDNRRELSSLLELPVTRTDAELAFEAFARWGEHAAARLLGDVAFIGWDGRRRRVVCARDHMGVRPLHYCAAGSTFVCATDVAQVLAHPDVPGKPDLGAVAGYLAMSLPNGPATLYRDVHRVPPGHVLVADARAARLMCYWKPEPGEPLRYGSDQAYADRCRELLVQSVGDRMRTDRPAAAFLSGGLDSSSIVTTAHALVHDRGVPPRPFSMVFPGHPAADERPFIDAVLHACNTTGVHLEPAPVAAGALAHRAALWAETPGMAADEMTRTTFEAMRAAGHRVALTGAGGDYLFSGSIFHYADLLRARRPLAAARRFAEDRRSPETRPSPAALLQAGVWPLLPVPWRRLLGPLARRLHGVRRRPAWLRLALPVERQPAAPRGGSFAAEDLTRALSSGMHAFFLESHERAAAEAGIELRHPLLDRRLIEFALNIPEEQRRRSGVTKYVLRQALHPYLAPLVAERRSKAGAAHVALEALESLGGERWFRTLVIADAGWVDPVPIVRSYSVLSASPRDNRIAAAHLPALWMISAIELWFRASFAVAAEPAAAAPAL